MPDSRTQKIDARAPHDLVARASERARKINPDAGLSGVIRYALALLAGYPKELAKDQLRERAHTGRPAKDRRQTAGRQ